MTLQSTRLVPRQAGGAGQVRAEPAGRVSASCQRSGAPLFKVMGPLLGNSTIDTHRKFIKINT